MTIFKKKKQLISKSELNKQETLISQVSSEDMKEEF